MIEQGTSLASVLPNLSVATVSILVIFLLSKEHQKRAEVKDKIFLQHLAERDEVYRAEINEREDALRTLEKEIRTSVMDQLGKNTNMMERVVDHIKNH